ncbi:dCMP deaminase, partial [Aliarcobacter butzleri]
VSIEGGTMYVTLVPCSECSQNLIARGKKRIVYDKAYEHTNSEIISKFLENNGVKIEQIPAIS